MSKTILNRREFLKNSSSGAVALGLLPFAKPVFASNTLAEGTGYLYDDRMLNHIIEQGHVECPERLIKIQEKMQDAGLDKEVVNLPFIEDTVSWIKEIHTDSHVSSVQNIPNTNVATEVAVGGALGGAKAVCEGTVRNAFCAIRPCGHHAHNTGKDEGFCYYNNVAIATKYIQQTYNIEKILIIDWDYHHGNATQDTFYRDGTVLFCSSHDQYGYPQTGNPNQTGAGDGAGLNINIHLEPDSDEDDLKRDWESRLMPKVETFKPEFVFISAGFDSRIDDIKGNLAITDTGFAELTKIALDIAKEYAGDKLCSMLEGGYYIDGTASATVHHVAELLAGSTGINPYRKYDRSQSSFINRRISSITITNVSGTVIKTISALEINNGKVYLNKAGLASGQYLVKVNRFNRANETVRYLVTK
jgi:acetoin utilization deacetylase AcuC-like enzyme